MSIVNRRRAGTHKLTLGKVFTGRLAGPALLVIARYTTNIIGPFVSLLVVRYLGAYDYGVYASAVAITTFFGILPDFGLQQAALEAHGLARASLRSILRSMLQLGFVFSLLAAAASSVWVLVGGYDLVVQHLVALLVIEFFQRPVLSTVTVKLQVQGMYGRLALWNLAASSVRWIGTAMAMVVDSHIYGLVAWPVLMSWALIGAMVLYERAETPGKVPAHPTTQASLKPLELMSRSVRFGSSGALHQVYHRFDSVLLSLVRDPVEVGAYAVAFRVIQLLNNFPGVVFGQVLYPKYFRWFRNERNKIVLYYRLMSKLMLSISFVATTLVTIFSRDAIELIFGASQEMTAVLLGVMAWSLPGRFVGASAGTVLTTGNQIEKKIQLQAILAAFSLALNVILIPRHGAFGAAAMLVATDFLLACLFARAVKRVYGLSLWESRRIRIMAVVLVMIGLLTTFSSIEAFIILRVLSVLAVVALGVMFVAASMSREETREVGRLLGLGSGEGS